MRRWLLSWIVLMLCVVGTGAAASAQADTDTPTPTATSTPTETPTPTPDVRVQWALPTNVNDAGTPGPTQYAEFAYHMDTGQVAISVLLALLILSVWAIFLIWLLTRRQGGAA